MHESRNDATAADGYCHAAINEARSFLEALVVNMVLNMQRDAAAPPAGRNGRDRSQRGTVFRTHRRYLLEAGFLDAEESELLQCVYSAASAKGSHHGVTDDGRTRLARRIVFATGKHLLHRYTTWKQNGRTLAPPSGQPAPPSLRTWLQRGIKRLVFRKRP